MADSYRSPCQACGRRQCTNSDRCKVFGAWFHQVWEQETRPLLEHQKEKAPAAVGAADERTEKISTTSITDSGRNAR